MEPRGNSPRKENESERVHILKPMAERLCESPPEGEGEEVEDKVLPVVNVRDYFGTAYHNQITDVRRQGAEVHAVLEDYTPICCTVSLEDGDRRERLIRVPALYSFDLTEVTCLDCQLSLARDEEAN